MKKIATLGPIGTFSDMATGMYISQHPDDFEVEYFPSIKAALAQIGASCQIGVIPIENFSEGFISLVLDELVLAELNIIAEMILPIKLSMISNVKTVSEIEQLFVQFVARGQCFEFVETVGHAKIITTDSNIESLDKLKKASSPSAAIVPSSSYQKNEFPLIIEEVNDYKNNQTRFLVLSKQAELVNDKNSKTSLIVLDDHDHPGFLGEILTSFSARNINLTSIISRPTRKAFGKYHFFIDFDGNTSDPLVFEAISEIGERNKIKLLGSYTKAKGLNTI